MNPHTGIEVLLAEDNPRDAELTLRTRHKRNLVNCRPPTDGGCKPPAQVVGRKQAARKTLRQVLECASPLALSAAREQGGSGGAGRRRRDFPASTASS